MNLYRNRLTGQIYPFYGEISGDWEKLNVVQPPETANVPEPAAAAPAAEKPKKRTKRG